MTSAPFEVGQQLKAPTREQIVADTKYVPLTISVPRNVEKLGGQLVTVYRIWYYEPDRLWIVELESGGVPWLAHWFTSATSLRMLVERYRQAGHV